MIILVYVSSCKLFWYFAILMRFIWNEIGNINIILILLFVKSHIPCERWMRGYNNICQPWELIVPRITLFKHLCTIIVDMQICKKVLFLLKRCSQLCNISRTLYVCSTQNQFPAQKCITLVRVKFNIKVIQCIF